MGSLLLSNGGDAPLEYLTVEESNNYSQIGNGRITAVTSYRRYRIDPTSLEINPLDNAFATNSGFEDFTPELADGLTSIPAEACVSPEQMIHCYFSN